MTEVVLGICLDDIMLPDDQMLFLNQNDESGELRVAAALRGRETTDVREDYWKRQYTPPLFLFFLLSLSLSLSTFPPVR